MTPSLTVPPTPQACFNCFASDFRSSSDNTRFLINVTALPPRPLESRCRYAVCCCGDNDSPLLVGEGLGVRFFFRKSPSSEDQTVLLFDMVNSILKFNSNYKPESQREILKVA